MLSFMMLAFCYFLTAVCLLFTILPLSSSEAWWVRATDFPRLQVAIFALSALAGLWLFGDVAGTPDMLLALALLIAVAYHAAMMAPYTALWPVELQAAERIEPGAAIKLMVVNVLMDNRETGRLFAMIDEQQPDVLLAVETDQWWCDQLDAITADFPFKLSHPLANTYGMFFCSRLELIRPEIRFLLKPDIPSIRTGIRLDGGKALTFYAVHPEPPSPTEADTALPRDGELIMVAKDIVGHGRHSIVAGDLNDVAWSHTSRQFRRLGRMLDPRVGRGLFSTFHAQYWPCRWPLDHVFASDDFVLQGIERLDAFGSDHFPIVVTLGLSPSATREQIAPEADDEDEAEARDKLERSRLEVERPQSQEHVPLGRPTPSI
jgi:endonuclease/exonuclease/phosphatase (EEP) superfamily protein YafD